MVLYKNGKFENADVMEILGEEIPQVDGESDEQQLRKLGFQGIDDVETSNRGYSIYRHEERQIWYVQVYAIDGYVFQAWCLSEADFVELYLRITTLTAGMLLDEWLTTLKYVVNRIRHDNPKYEYYNEVQWIEDVATRAIGQEPRGYWRR